MAVVLCALFRERSASQNPSHTPHPHTSVYRTFGKRFDEHVDIAFVIVGGERDAEAVVARATHDAIVAKGLYHRLGF